MSSTRITKVIAAPNETEGYSISAGTLRALLDQVAGCPVSDLGALPALHSAACEARWDKAQLINIAALALICAEVSDE